MLAAWIVFLHAATAGIQGRIIDPEKVLLEGATDEGTRWDGVFDDVGLRVVFIISGMMLMIGLG